MHACSATFAFEEQVGNSKVVREPVGVVVAITPWNYPLHQIAAKVAAALAAGCTVVLKPSEVAPLNAFALAEIIHDAGVPAGVFNLVTGFGPEIGEALVTHPQVDMVSFTGSTNAGKRISQLAADTVKRVALELGGKSAGIVLDDADFASRSRAWSATATSMPARPARRKRACWCRPRATTKPREIAAAAGASFKVGDPLLPETTLGPLASKMQQDRVRDYIAKGIACGAELLAGGTDLPADVPAGGYYVQPTVFGRVDPRAVIAQEEIFGPVLSIITYTDEDDAVRIANDSIYGLSGGVWSATDARAESRGAAPAHRSGRDQRRAPSTSTRPSAATSSRATGANWASTAWRTSSN
jgi:aldehyde dehydrogenase (NAD+)